MELPTWLLELPPYLLHGTVFAVLLLEGIGIPGIPFELLWVAEGLLIHAGKTTLGEAIVWGTLGNWIGNLIGYQFGHLIAGWLPKKVREAVQLEDVKRWYAKYGVWVVIVSRWFGFLRTPFILYAGIAEVRFWSYIWSSFLGCLLWVGVWQWGLWKSGEAFLQWWQNYQPLLLGAIAGIVLALAAVVVFRIVKRPRSEIE